MNCFKKIILLVFAGFIFSATAEELLSFSFLYPVQNAKQFNETSRYVSGFRYSWVVSSYFPERVQELLGAWHIQLGAGWLHTIPRKASSISEDKKKKEEQKKIKPLISYYPAVITGGLNWEFDHLHYVRPVLGAGYSFHNPLNNSVLQENSFMDRKSYFITAGVLLSFDIVDFNFSQRMSYEYGIRDMGLFAEYQRYYSLEQESHRHWGANVGFFIAF